MSGGERQAVMRTCFLRLELVVLLHCFNLFIHIESIERDVSVLSHLYIILINMNAKDVSLQSTHADTHTDTHTDTQTCTENKSQ